MSFNKILIAIVFSFIATQAFAIDGYKDLKFGITQKEVLASNLCSFESTNTGYDGVLYFPAQVYKGAKIVSWTLHKYFSSNSMFSFNSLWSFS